MSAQVAQRQRRQQCASRVASSRRHCVQLQPGEVHQAGQRLQAILGQLPALQHEGAQAGAAGTDGSQCRGLLS